MKIATLPTLTRMNPSKPEKAQYYDSALVLYVLRRPCHFIPSSQTQFQLNSTLAPNLYNYRAFTSYGGLSELTLNSLHAFTHDQTMATLGNWEVCGIRHLNSPSAEGYIPTVGIPHWVCK